MYLIVLGAAKYLCNFVLIDGEAELDHSVDARAEDVGVIQTEARRQQCGVEQQKNKLFDGFVALVGIRSLPQLLHLMPVLVIIGIPLALL